MNKMKVLILGVTGMVGHKLFHELSKQSDLDVYATSKSTDKISKLFEPDLMAKVISGIDATKIKTISDILNQQKPDVVINCIGITKQLVEDDDPCEAIEINSLFPHFLARECKRVSARMIQMATDCVFSGKRGNYVESDSSDADDLYGRTKYLGEVYYGNNLTIRTSFIGHELGTRYGLVEWFLAQKSQIRGFSKAMYSGLPTILVASILANYVLNNKEMRGLYHLSAEPISKYDLLQLIAKIYDKKIEIAKEDATAINRSLNSDHFRKVTGYEPLGWEEMIKIMHQDYIKYGYSEYKENQTH